MKTLPFVFFALSCLVFTTVRAQFVQQGNKLVGTGAIGNAQQGGGCLSADGNTLIVEGTNDNRNTGAIWVFTRSNGVWKQQGGKLVGTGAVGESQQGSISLSGDGNTVIVGGPGDNNRIGAVWVFTRSNGAWKQQGEKLVGTGAVGQSNQGTGVAISADGNTAIVGAPGDNNDIGATWVYTRNGGVWTQQGNKLVGTGGVGRTHQDGGGISADGNTLIVGGLGDNNYIGASWIFTRSNGEWKQQGNKLVGTGVVGTARQGWSASISADGNTAIVGGISDDNDAGAAWVFARSGGVWTQQGDKLVGTGAVGNPVCYGCSCSLSGDGNTAIVGGVYNNNYLGGAWVYTRNGGVWSQQGNILVGTGAVGNSFQGASVAISADGNTASVGGTRDNHNTGAVWVYFKSDMPAISSITDIPSDQEEKTTVSVVSQVSPEFPFRQTKWGMAVNQVKKSEKSKLKVEIADALSYKGTVQGMKTSINYKFRKNKLVAGSYFFEEDHSFKNDYIEDYERVKSSLIKKYGKPMKSYTDWKNDLFRNSPQDRGTAVSIGHLEYVSYWETDKTRIHLTLRGDNYKINFILSYRSIEFGSEKKDEEENDTKDY